MKLIGATTHRPSKQAPATPILQTDTARITGSLWPIGRQDVDRFQLAGLKRLQPTAAFHHENINANDMLALDQGRYVLSPTELATIELPTLALRGSYGIAYKDVQWTDNAATNLARIMAKRGELLVGVPSNDDDTVKEYTQRLAAARQATRKTSSVAVMQIQARADNALELLDEAQARGEAAAILEVSGYRDSQEFLQEFRRRSSQVDVPFTIAVNAPRHPRGKAPTTSSSLLLAHAGIPMTVLRHYPPGGGGEGNPPKWFDRSRGGYQNGVPAQALGGNLTATNKALDSLTSSTQMQYRRRDEALGHLQEVQPWRKAVARGQYQRYVTSRDILYAGIEEFF